MLEYENKLWSEGYCRVMGLDEVGRGCLAGPVVAAGVIFNSKNIPAGLADSKTLSASVRNQLKNEILLSAEYVVVLEGSVEEIDRLNILWASIDTMRRCAETTDARADYLLIDGNRFTTSIIPYSCIIGGDSKSASIAAASIVAKVYRDDVMSKLHLQYPHYGWDTNVGYPTKKHRDGIRNHGITDWHRKSYQLLS